MIQRWLTLHKQAAPRLSNELLGALSKQQQRVMQRFRDLSGMVFLAAAPLRSAALSLDACQKTRLDIRPEQLLPAGDEDRFLHDAARPVMAQIIRHGGRLETQRGDLARLRKAHASGLLSKQLENFYEQALDEVFNTEYWNGINSDTRLMIERLLATSVMQGWTARETVRRIEEDSLHIFDDVRATRIASTETTALLGFGQWAARDELITEGIVDGEEWLTVIDDRRRDSHANTEGQTVSRRNGAWAAFDAAGNQIGSGRAFVLIDPSGVLPTEYARFPGDPNLSAGNRISCRCLATSLPAI